jgi:hypothetical protein
VSTINFTQHRTECLARTLRLESLAAWPHLGFCCPPPPPPPPTPPPPPFTKNPGYASEPCVVNLVTFLFIMNVSDVLEQPCDKSDNANKLVPSCFNNWEQAQCEHNLSTACEQICNNLFVDLEQLVRFYVCTLHNNVWII